jgi:hypothetical protein
MKWKLGFRWLALVLLFLTSASHAQTGWIECQGCNQWSAKSIAEQGWAPATRIIFDAAQNTAWKFDVQREQVGPNCQVNVVGDPKGQAGASRTNGGVSGPTNNAFGSCQWANIAYPTMLDSADTEVMVLLHDAFIETGGTWKRAIPINRDDIFIMTCSYCVEPSGSGYDVVNDMQFRNQLRDGVGAFVNSLRSSLANLMSYVGHAVEVAFLNGTMSLTIVVKFPDGTLVPVVFNDQSPLGNIDEDLVTDENGRQLMNQGNRDTFAHFGAVYASPSGAENFLRNAERLGVEVTRAGGGGGRTINCTWKCVETSNGASCKLSCSSQ